jgi:Ca2+-binding RTX toxin-like protein
MFKSLNLKGSRWSDLLIGGFQGDTIKGLRGNDILVGLWGADILTGGRGADILKYFSFADSRGAHTDLVTDFNAREGDKVDLRPLGTAVLQPVFNAAFSTLQAVFTYNAEADRTTLSYYQGSSTPVFQVQFNGEVRFSADSFLGIVQATEPTEGNDSLVGSSGSDTIDLLGGNDRYDGLGGDDTVRGGAGIDVLKGGLDNDTLSGGTGSDRLEGGSGDDFLDGGDGSDRLYGGDGKDFLFGGDWISGSDDRGDLLDGGGGDDELNGWEGDDRLFGGTGNDLLHGSYGTDTLTGGAGADIFSYTSAIDGNDIIVDFSRAEGDKIDISGSDSNLSGRDGQTGWWFAGDSYRTDLQSAGQGQIVVTANGDGTYTFSAYYANTTTAHIQTIVNAEVTVSDFIGVTEAPPPAMGLVF